NGFTWNWYTASGVHAGVFDDASFVVVHANEPKQNINVTLTPGGAAGFGGRITQGTSGLAVPNAIIEVRERLSGASVTTLVGVSDGGYVVPGLADGQYTLRFTAEGFNTQWLNGKDTREAADVLTIVQGGLQQPPPVGLDVALAQGT